VWAAGDKTMHPSNRAERRNVREVWRNYRRFIILTSWNHYPSYNMERAMENGGWFKGGKQYFACGNRCPYAMLDRYFNHQEVKRFRREPIELEDD
jgi:hypothetical protein